MVLSALAHPIRRKPPFRSLKRIQESNRSWTVIQKLMFPVGRGTTVPQSQMFPVGREATVPQSQMFPVGRGATVPQSQMFVHRPCVGWFLGASC